MMEEKPVFRELGRKKQQLPEEACIRVLTNEKRGVLSVMGENGYPYGMPMNFWYDPDSGHIFFHGGKAGHKIDALKKNDKVSFCVCNQGFQRPGEWAWNVSSVILFGRIVFMEDTGRIENALRHLGCKYTDDTGYVEKEILTSGHHVLCLELIPEHMTGKLVNES